MNNESASNAYAEWINITYKRDEFLKQRKYALIQVDFILKK